MKSKCSFILKASLSLVLALILLFGTVATSVAATVKNESAAEERVSDYAGTPFRDADGKTKIVIYYDDTYSKLSESEGFENLFFVIIGDTYYRGYKMADLRKDNKYFAIINESYTDAKTFFVMAVDKDWTGETSEAVGAPFDENVKKLPGVIGYTDAYTDEFVFETTNADKGHGYLLNTTEDAELTLEANDIGVCPQEVVIPDPDAEDDPDASSDTESFLAVFERMVAEAKARIESESVENEETETPAKVDMPAGVIADAVPADDATPADDAAADAAEEQPVKAGKKSDLADTGASAGTWKVTYKKDMPSGAYNTETTYYNMTRSTNNTNRYYYVATGLTANSSYGFFLQYNSSNYWKANATISLGGHTKLYDYGNSNFGNSNHRVTFTTGSATSYVFMFDISTNEVFVNSITPGVEFTYDVASGHDNNYDLDNKVSMTYSNYLYTCDIASMSAAKYYLFCKVGDHYYRGTSTLTTSSSASLWDYGTSNFGNSGDKLNFTPGSAGKYRFTYDVRDATVSVVKVYDITYNKNNGTGSLPANQTVTAGSSVTIGTNSLARTGYTASGWNTNSSGTGTNYANGASYTANANLTLYAKWTEKTSTFTVQAGSNGTITKSGTNSGVSSYVTVSAVTPSSGYSFVGWQISGADASHVIIKNSSGAQVFDGTNWTSEANQYLTAIRVYSDGSSASMNATVTAVFAKAHYISIYNTTMYDRAHWVVLGSPPQTVRVTHASGAVTTYTYSAGTKAQRGEDRTTSGSPGTSNTKTSGTYYEGNKLTIYTGDTIELIYSALASSDIISGVFYNNDIRYTTELEDDNLFWHRTYNASGYGDAEDGYKNGASAADPPDDDVPYVYDANYSAAGGHALFASPGYYKEPDKTTINNNASSYAASVDQDTHIVSWTAGDRDYLNIDIDLSSKKQVHFSDTANTVINSIHTDNYYAIGEDVSPNTGVTTSLSVKAAGNADQKNSITKANIKFYYCNNMGEYINPATGKKVSKANRVELTGADATLSAQGTASISNSGATASSNFIYIDGAMPATDVMVDLDLVVSYSLTLRSKVMYDSASSNKKVAFGQVANLTMGSTTYSLNNSCTTTTDCATGTYNAGTGVTLQVSSITSGWIFTGWFLGDSSGPNLDSEPLSTSETWSYKPTQSGYIWAVGTKGLYIAGNKYLFNDNANWATAHEMEFDATLGTTGKYYWEIDETIFTAANRAYTCVDNNTTTTKNIKGYFSGGGTYRYWNGDSDTYHGNAYFQFYDASSGTLSQDATANKTVWGNVLSFETEASNVRYGKVYKRDQNGSDGAGSTVSKQGEGFIAFSESTYSGWSTPIRIYYDPATTGTFTVEPTGVYPHIHVSSGTKGLDVAEDGTPSAVSIKVNSGTARNNTVTSTDYSSSSYLKFEGAGWNPTNEGHVCDAIVTARNATLTLTKTTSNSDYKVSNFVVYNMTKGTVKAYPATATGTANQYSCNTIKTSDDDRLYIVPILEYIGSGDKMTVIVDSTQLDYDEWGKLVGCYVWGGSSKNGAYPGQLMVPSDDGLSWKATFNATGMTGVTLTNYVDSYGGTGYTFIAMSGVMGTVSVSGSGTVASPRKETATGGYVTYYNKIEGTDGGKGTYDKTNFKAQTYDYREPVAYYNNKPAGASSTVLTFALKEGNGELITWRHSDLTSENILKYKTAHPSWKDINFEYLTDSSGKHYADLNGFVLPEKPTASFYIAAKAMVIYSDNSMTKVFYTGKSGDTTSGITYNDYKGKVTGEIDMNFAVQWYVYDASGKYITNVLSAGFADKSASNNDMSVVTQRLLDLGYAVEGRSVKICYDVPRYCYTNDNNVVQSGTGFDVYRFTGQWYEDSEYKTAKVYAKVGLKTDNGDVIADSSSAAYGSATVAVNGSKCSIAGHHGVDTEDGVDYGYTTIVDGDKGAITLTASSTNFIGWYHKNNEGELELDTKETSFTPSYSKDSTYIAMYEAKAIYRYNYEGREADRSYGVGSSYHLDAAEIANGNLVKTDDTHISDVVSNFPGESVATIFKKTLTWSTPTKSNLTSTEEYILDVGGATVTPTNYTLTYKYKNASGSLQTKSITAPYNTQVDLTASNSGTSPGTLWTGHRFIGWYDNSTGELLSTQGNFGLSIVKTMTIIAKYADDNVTAPTDDNWYVFIDDQGVTKEMYSSTTGTIYNDTIVRVRNNSQGIGGRVNTGGAEVGVLIFDNNGGSGTYSSVSLANLRTIAAALNSTGSTAVINSTTGAKVTKVCTTNVTNFGRADLALRGSYANLTGHKYAIYAYIKVGNSFVFNTTPKTGTYS